MRTETKEVYIADDGKQFATVEECQAHERRLVEQEKRIAGLMVYRVRHSFDGTEGRGYYGNTIIVTDSGLPEVIQYCLDRWGQPLTGWYGDGYYQAWHLHKDDGDDALSRALSDARAVPAFSYAHKATDLVLLSQAPVEHDQLPEPVFPWPRKAPSSEGENLKRDR